VAQFLTENLMLAMVGSAGGLVVALWTTSLSTRFLPYNLEMDTGWSHTTLSPGVLVVTVAVTVLATLAAGWIPVARASRLACASLVGQWSDEPRRSRGRNLLVITQLVLAVSLVTIAVLFGISLREAGEVPLGFDDVRRFSISFDLGPHGYDLKRAEQFRERVFESVGRTPGVRRVSATAFVPFQGMMRVDLPIGDEGEDSIETALELVSPGYFATMGIPLHKGRDFTAIEAEGEPAVVAINRAAERRLFPEGAIGGTVTVWGGPSTVIAVVGDTRFNDLGEAVLPRVFVPRVLSIGPRFNLIVEAEGHSEEVALSVEKVVRSLDPNLPIRGAVQFEDLVEAVHLPYRTGALLAAVLAVLALLFSTIGVYGLLSHRVLLRERTIGVRMALGATGKRVVGSVLLEGMVFVAIGTAIGLLLAWSTGRLLESFLFRVMARDLRAFFLAPLVLTAVVLVASWIPARRAARIDPSVILKR
jgi:predicted permease